MKNRWLAKAFIPLLILMLVLPLLGTGCKGEEKVTGPAPLELSSTMVPDVPVDVYAYCKQDNSTRVPLSIGNNQQNMEVESVAMWGVPSGSDFAFGMGITLTSAKDASYISDRIGTQKDLWKKLSDRVIYLVYGSGPAAESLKSAISAKNFKKYDNEKGLKALAAMPGTAKLAGVVVAEPSEALINYMAKSAGEKDISTINTMVSLGKFEVLAAGLYSPNQIDLVKMMDAVKSENDLLNLDMGFVVMLKSGLPGLVVEPVVKKILTDNKFVETKVDGLAVYKGSWDVGKGVTVPILVRLEGNYVYAVVSGKDAYAQTLLADIAG